MFFASRPLPMESESFFGYLLRFAEENALGVTVLLDALDAPSKPKPLIDTGAPVLQALDVDEDRKAAMLPVWEGAGLLDRRFDRGDRDAVCPACLAETGLRRVAHRHRLVTACDHHHCELLDHCPDCGDPLRVFEGSNTLCPCGCDLARLRPVPASKPERLVAKVLGAPASHPAIQSTAPDAVLPVSGFLWAMMRNGGDLGDDGGAPLRVPPKDVATVRALVATGAAPLRDWPEGLHGFLKTRLDESAEAGVGLAARLGSWYRALRRVSHPAFAPFWDEVTRYATTYDDIRYGGFEPGASAPPDDADWMTAKRAANRLGVDAEHIRDAVQAGTIEGRCRDAGVNYRNTSLRRDVVERLAARRTELLTKREVCTRFGLSRKVVERLIEREIVFRADELHPLFKGLLDAGALHAAEARVRARKPGAGARPSLVALNDIATTGGKDVDRVVDGVLAIRDGAVRAFWTEGVERALGQCCIDQAALPSRDIGEVEGLTLKDIAGMSGWKPQVVAHWCRTGLLDCTWSERMPKGEYRVSLNALLAFQRRYIPLADLARECGSSSRAVRERLFAGGCRILGGMKDGAATRGEVVEIASLAKVTTAAKARA